MLKLKTLWEIGLNASLSGFQVGYHLVVFNMTQENVAHSLNWGENTQLYISLFTSLLLIGAMVGAPEAGYYSNKQGRRKGLLLGNLLIEIGAICTLVPFTLTFGLGRLISGVAVGFHTTLGPVYLAEMSVEQLTGRLGALFSFVLAIGSTLAYAFGLLLPDDPEEPMNNWWLGMFALPMLISIVQSVILLKVFNFDTPVWVAAHTHTRRESTVTLESQPEPHLEPLPQTWQNNKKKMRSGLAAISAIPVSGISFFTFYSVHLYSTVGYDMFWARFFSTCLGLIEIIGVGIALYTVGRFKRRHLLISGLLTNSVCYALIVLTLEWFKVAELIVVLTLLFKLVFSACVTSVAFVYLSEVLNEKGVGIGTSLFWVLFAIAGFISLYLIDYLGLAGSMLLFCLLNLGLGIYLMADMIETKPSYRVASAKYTV